MGNRVRVVCFRLVALLVSVFPPLLHAQEAIGTAGSDLLTSIEARGELQVCIWPDYYGISYRNPKSGDLSGIDVDMARALAADLGVELRFVESSFSQLIDDLLSSQCDIAMFAIGVTPQRQKWLDFSTPHLQSDIYAITTRSNRLIQRWEDIDRPGVVVAVAKGTLHEPVMRERLKHAQLSVLDTPFAREQEVESGRADLFMTDYPYSQRMLVRSDWARLVAPVGSYHITPYAWAMKPGQLRWHERVERFVEAIKRDGRLREAAERYHLLPLLRSQ